MEEIKYPPPFKKESARPNGREVYRQRTESGFIQAEKDFVAGYREAIYQIKKLNKSL